VCLRTTNVVPSWYNKDKTTKGKQVPYVLEQTSYVSEDGNYGTGLLITFPYDALNEDQWGVLDILPDSQKLEYAQAILDGQADLSEWED
jgi:hypothetical protein